ncbi:MAG: hypothetical protein ABIT08_14420 [Bacteroidia bacterium]
MIKFLFTALFSLLIYSHSLIAANKYSRANGNWTATATWSNTSGGASCGCTPGGSDDIYISHNVILNKNLTNSDGISGSLTINSGGTLNGGSTYDIEIKTGGVLTVNGTLKVFDLTFFNGSFVTVNSTASVTVNGTLHNKNNSNNVVFNGPVTVVGPFINGNGATISGAGPLVITNGPASNSGGLFGCNGTIPSTFPINFPGPCIISLPVELISFKASGNNPVILEWITASETNNKFFSLQKSYDADHFSLLANIPGAGNTVTTMRYTFTDHAPGGRVYYRLTQSDFNGDEHILKILSVQPDPSGCIEISSRKNKNITIHFSCDENNKGGLLLISDMMGNSVKEQKIQSINSSSFQQLFYSLPDGIYLLTLIYDYHVIKKVIRIF